ncbi:MAG: hypothetical protein AB8H80_05005 [Planctomycetota bacterium]
MTPISKRTLQAASFLLVATTCAAQIPSIPIPQIRRQGPFSVWPVGVVLSPLNPYAVGNTLKHVKVAPRANPPEAPIYNSAWSRPDYSKAALLPHLPLPLRNVFEMDGVDSGNALTPDTWKAVKDNSQNVIGFSPNLAEQQRWLALSASVTTSSPLTLHPLLSSGDGNTIFSYFFEDSVGLPASMNNALHIEQTGAQMLLPVNEELSAFDYKLGMLMSSPDDELARFAPKENYLYFSVTPNFVAIYNGMPNALSLFPFAADKATPNVLEYGPDAAVIYQSTWTPAEGNTPGSWSNPILWKTRTDLGLSNSAAENIDALTVEHDSETVIFSMTRIATLVRDQILVHLPNYQPLGSLPLYDDDGFRVSDKMGIADDDDVDALCGDDPEVMVGDVGRAAGAPMAFRYAPLAGNPLFAGLAEPVGFSIARSAPNGSAPPVDIKFQITGWGPLQVPVPCNVDIYVSVTPIGGQPSNYSYVGTLTRNSSQDEWHWTLPVTTFPVGIQQVSFEATLTCSDPLQWIDPINKTIVPSTAPGATQVVGATYPLAIKF